MKVQVRHYVEENAGAPGWLAWIDDKTTGITLMSFYCKTESAARKNLRGRIVGLARRLQSVKF
jgi:hypothetical protein